MPDISIIIVNYNVKEYLANLLNSLERARGEYDIEILVVDNASSDGSLPYLQKEFSHVQFIANQTNLGFGKANNQAIRKAKGKYTLLINPDTIVSEDTLDVMFKHMESHPQTAFAGCKLLNPDGSFAPESRRQIPTPSIALWKILGLTKLFPKSKRFAGYYMNWLEEDTPSEVPVLSGSFMFCRTAVLHELNGFDEDFFMYGEDIDLCYRALEAGYKIDYVPATSIIHYKGESTKKSGLDYHIIFNKSNYLFFRKHFSFGYSLLFRAIVLLGVVGNIGLNYITSLLSRSSGLIRDVILGNVIIFILFLLRYQISLDKIMLEYEQHYLVVNLIYSVFFIILAIYYELYRNPKRELITVFKASAGSFAIIVLVTFFWRDYAFSRWILLWGAFLTPFVLILYRLAISRKRKTATRSHGVKPIRIVLAGVDENIAGLISKIRSQVEWNYEIVGILAQEEKYIGQTIENIPVIGLVPVHSGLLEYHKVNEVFFLIPALNYKDVLKALSKLRNPDITTKLIPDSMEYIIGKTNVEYLDDVPLMDLSIEYNKPINKFLKRQFDFWLSLLMLIVIAPLAWMKLIFGYQDRKIIKSVSKEDSSFEFPLFLTANKNKLSNYYSLLKQVLKGDISLVGSPITNTEKRQVLSYKPGITGLRQINENRLFHQDEKERYELYYLQNYSIWLDVDILLKTLLSEESPLSYIEKNNI